MPAVAVAPAPPMASPIAASPSPSLAPRAAGESFPARLRAAQRLNRDGSEKDTRLVVIETETGSRFPESAIASASSRATARSGEPRSSSGSERSRRPVLSPDGVERPLGRAGAILRNRLPSTRRSRCSRRGLTTSRNRGCRRWPRAIRRRARRPPISWIARKLPLGAAASVRADLGAQPIEAAAPIRSPRRRSTAPAGST